VLLLIDNYDSFTYNLYQYLSSIGVEVLVRRNDALTLEDVAELRPDQIVISPGPGGPADAGISLDVIREFSARVPILGVCLGHQCIGAAYGGRIVRAPELRHGKGSPIGHDGRGVFAGLPQNFEAIRYHSLVVDRASVPDCLEISAWTPDGLVMGLRHRERPVEGVQFHPESILTEGGLRLLANFVGVSHLPELSPTHVAGRGGERTAIARAGAADSGGRNGD
jgi:anthranilate synthase component 2